MDGVYNSTFIAVYGNPINILCGDEALRGNRDVLWGLFGGAFVFNFVACIFWFLVGGHILRFVFRESWDKLVDEKPHYALTSVTEVAVLWNASLVTVLILAEAVYNHMVVMRVPEKSFTIQGRPASWLGTGALLGYMSWHLILLLRWRTYMTKCMGPALFKLMCVHHILSLLIWPIAFWRTNGIYFTTMFCASEVSTLPMCFRTWGLRVGRTEAVWFQLSRIIWVFVFCLSRILPMPYMIYAAFHAEHWSVMASWELPLAACIFIPMMLNTWWFLQMLVGIGQALGCISKEKDD